MFVFTIRCPSWSKTFHTRSVSSTLFLSVGLQFAFSLTNQSNALPSLGGPVCSGSLLVTGIGSVVLERLMRCVGDKSLVKHGEPSVRLREKEPPVRSASRDRSLLVVFLISVCNVFCRIDRCARYHHETPMRRKSAGGRAFADNARPCRMSSG